ncbi:histidine kinase [Neobacillus sp. YX16]|nr:histidine kinase [Neobacillus sp. YX16]WHZ03883.1 histidine kinase [Neobacillus sp. YX16]
MFIVMILAMWRLEKDYIEIDLQTRIFISAGASVFSGLVSYFLFFRGDKN